MSNIFPSSQNRYTVFFGFISCMVAFTNEISLGYQLINLSFSIQISSWNMNYGGVLLWKFVLIFLAAQ